MEMRNKVLKCYEVGSVYRILCFVIIVGFTVASISSVFEVIFQGINPVPYEDKFVFFSAPCAILFFSEFLVRSIQITEDKLSVVGLFRRRELHRGSIVGEFYISKVPGYDAHYFEIQLKTGKKFRFSFISKKSRNCVQKLLDQMEWAYESF